MVTVVVVGAGERGYEAFGKEILRRKDIKAVAIAEPDKGKRERFSKDHNIKPELQFQSYEELFSKEKIADGAIIATMDSLHVDPTVMALKRGYKVILEKPIDFTPEGIKKVIKASEETGLPVIVGLVLRYTRYLKKVKTIMDSGVIGKIISIDHRENIGFWHFGHAFVRGNWRNTKIAAPSLLAKSCHDMDLLFWLAGDKCSELSSSGGLMYFKKENAPKGSGARCMDCPPEIEKACPYSAKKLYLTDHIDWPVSAISLDRSYEAREKALKEGPYGRCVYKCDNDVSDYQTVNMNFRNGVKAVFTMSAFNTGGREMRVSGSHGEIKCVFDASIELIKFDGFSSKTEKIDMAEITADRHGGGDAGLVEEFVKVLGGEKTAFALRDSAYSHFMAFAAEKSKFSEGVPVKVEEF